ncbi:MAG: hypothetical protein WCP97_07670 [bacterium]
MGAFVEQEKKKNVAGKFFLGCAYSLVATFVSTLLACFLAVAAIMLGYNEQIAGSVLSISSVLFFFLFVSFSGPALKKLGQSRVGKFFIYLFARVLATMLDIFVAVFGKKKRSPRDKE